MKYKAVLNNYMFGVYGKGCLRDFIIEQQRIDKGHTQVILNIPIEHFNFVKKLLGADIYKNRLVKID